MCEPGENDSIIGASSSSKTSKADDMQRKSVVIRWAQPSDKDVLCFFEKSSQEDFPKDKVPQCLMGYLWQAIARLHNSSNGDSSILKDVTCRYCNQFFPDMTDSEEMRHHEEYCKSQDTAMDKRIEASKDKQCAVCHETVYHEPSGSQAFGTLSCCNHVFCYTCISTWFTQTSEQPNQEDRSHKQLVMHKGCPMCRKEPVLFASSKWWFSDQAEKQQYFSEVGEAMKMVLYHSCNNCKRKHDKTWRDWCTRIPLME